MSRHRKVGRHLEAASTIHVPAHPFRGGRGDHAGRPEDGATGDPLARDDDALGIDKLDPRIGPHLDAKLGEGLLRDRGKIFGEGRQDARRALQEQHLRAGRIDVAKLAMHAVVGELGDGAGELDTSRPAADDHEGEETFLLDRIVGIFRVLEGDQKTPGGYRSRHRSS